jgi:single-stranded DNA-binding protein
MAEIKGIVRSVGPVQQVSDKYSKRDLIIVVTESWGGQNPGSKEYPVVITFGGAAVSKLDNVGVGQPVRVEYNLRGRDWTDKNGEVKTFNSIDGYKVDVEGSVASNLDKPSTQNASAPVQQATVDIDSDALPF